jgi:hypothetical protein
MSDSAIIEQQDPQNEIVPRRGGFDVTSEDIDIPRLNVVQAVSQIEAPHGSIVIDKRHVLAEVNTPITVIPMSAIKGYREDKPYGLEGMGRSVYSPEDLEALKKDTEFPVVEFANITLMFPEPKEAKGSGAYPFPIGKKNYAIGTLNVAKMAYAQTFKRLATYGKFRAADDPAYNVFWELEAITIDGKVTYFAPSLRVKDTEDSPDKEVIAFIDKFNK